MKSEIWLNWLSPFWEFSEGRWLFYASVPGLSRFSLCGSLFTSGSSLGVAAPAGLPVGLGAGGGSVSGPGWSACCISGTCQAAWPSVSVPGQVAAGTPLRTWVGCSGLPAPVVLVPAAFAPGLSGNGFIGVASALTVFFPFLPDLFRVQAGGLFSFGLLVPGPFV